MNMNCTHKRQKIKAIIPELVRFEIEAVSSHRFVYYSNVSLQAPKVFISFFHLTVPMEAIILFYSKRKHTLSIHSQFFICEKRYCSIENCSYFVFKTLIVGTCYNCLAKAVLSRIHSQCFGSKIKKNDTPVYLCFTL